MNKTLFCRSLLFILGLFTVALGVDLSVKANLGVTAVSCIPYVYCLTFPLSLGQTTIIFNILLIFFQFLILQKEFQWVQLIQLPLIFLFGVFIDLTMPLLQWIEPTSYLEQVFFCLVSCAVVALGVYFEVKAQLTYLPGEGVAMAVSQRFGTEFGKSKIGIDCSLVAFALISSLVFIRRVEGVREGTVVAAMFVGCIVRFYERIIPFRPQWLAAAPAISQDVE